MFTTADILIAKLIKQKELNEQERLQAEAALREKELQALLKSVDPFTPEECTAEARSERLAKCRKNFWAFDAVYFPKEMYEAYFPASKFHKEIISLSDLKDKKAHIIAGPREFAKTAMLKKKFVYDFLFGRRRYMAIGSETIDPAVSAIKDILYFLTTNDRILFDFDLNWHEASSEKLFATSIENPKGTYIDALSAERSARGKQRGFFQRLDYILVTDFENLTVSLTPEAVEKRIQRLNEMRTSLSDSGTLIWEGNNFDPDCAMNYLFKEQELGILSENFAMHRYKAWDKKSLWTEKYPAKTEEEMKKLCKPKDAYDWAGNFQQEPKKKSGDIFPDNHYNEWKDLPKDLRAVIYADPNCSLKSKGDTTAIPCLAFSADTQIYYITTARCRSYSDPNELISDLLTMRTQQTIAGVRIRGLAFDGSVAQESQWTANVANYSRLKNIPVPFIDYKRYKVDELSKNAESLWKSDKILFPPGFIKTEEGKRFCTQVFSFISKKAKRKDDAPDALICALEYLYECGISPNTSGPPEYHSISKRRITSIV